MGEVFNSREIATALWLAVFATWALTRHDIKSSLRDLTKAFLKWKILVPFFAMLVYLSLVIIGLSLIGFWDVSATKDTVIWVFGVAMIMMFRAEKAQKEDAFFRNVVLDNLKLIAVLELVVNAYTFNLLAELIIVPFVTFVVMLKTVAEFMEETEKKYRTVDKLLGYILAVAGFILIGVAFWKALQDLVGFASWHNLRDFFLPVVLSILYLPFVYVWALFLAYDHLFVRIDIFNEDRALARHLKKAVFKSFHFNLRNLVQWSNRAPHLHVGCRGDITELISNPSSRY